MRERPTKTKLNYPVSLDEAKRHLRIDDSWDKDNDYIRNLIYAATEKCEQYIGKDISETENVLKIWDFIGSDFYVEEGNFLELTSVQASDASTSLSVEETQVYYNRFYVELTSYTNQDPLYVNYKTGYEPGSVPSIIKQAVLVKIGDFYDNERSSYNKDRDNRTFERLLDSFKIILY